MTVIAGEGGLEISGTGGVIVSAGPITRRPAPAFLALLDAEVTTLCRLFTLTFTSGDPIYLTSLDVDVVRGGITYMAGTGFDATALEQKADGSVNNTELTGLLTAGVITLADIRAGKFDDAELTVELVDYTDPDAGSIILLGGFTGNAQTTVGGAVVLEGLGVQQWLTRPPVAVYTARRFPDVPPAEVLLRSPGAA